MMKYLVDMDANPNSSNFFRINPMHCAAQGNNPISLAFFQRLGHDIDTKDKRQLTPLHWAAHHSNDYAMSYLLREGANFDARDEKGRTSLHFAVIGAEQVRTTRCIRSLL